MSTAVGGACGIVTYLHFYCNQILTQLSTFFVDSRRQKMYTYIIVKRAGLKRQPNEYAARQRKEG
nr:MAG TPA: hypothetical protein [Caudoviricetes sp.]